MSYTLNVLRAVMRVSRKSARVTVANVSERAGGSDRDLRVALRELESSGLLSRGTDEVRLTFAGLAVAIASVPPIADRARRSKRATSRAA